MKYSFILNGEVLYTIIYVYFRIVKSFTQSCTEFFLKWIMLSEFRRGVALVGVVGRDLTALSHSLLRRRFLLRQNDKFKFKGKFKGKVLLAWRANGIVIWNTIRLK